MSWSTVEKYDLLIDSKELGIKLTENICRRLDLGQSVDGYTDMLYLISNVIFAMENISPDYTEDQWDHLYEIYTKILARHNRYKGL